MSLLRGGRRSRLRGATLMAALTVLIAASAPAGAQVSLAVGSAVEAVERLKPGEFLWAPEVAPEGPLLMIVDVATQRAILYRNGIPIAVTTVSTGRAGHRTPLGAFTVLQKQIEHYSSIYDSAPMPYMERLTWGGVALHGGTLPGYAASHGCIRLPHEFARLLYEVSGLGMTVIVTDAPALPRVAPADSPLLGTASGPTESPSTVVWQPERAPSGPVSILVSAADRRLTILRDGHLIGSAPVSLPSAVIGTTVYLFAVSDSSGPHWVRVPVESDTPGAPLAEDFWQSFGVEPQFRQALSGIIGPGTRIVLTQDSLIAAHVPTAKRP